MSAERFLKAILVATALMVAVPAAAQTVSSADLQRLQDDVYQASSDVSRLRSTDATAAARLQEQLDDLRDEVTYLKVKLRKEGSISRSDYSDVQTRLQDLRARAHQNAGTSSSSSYPSDADRGRNRTGTSASGTSSSSDRTGTSSSSDRTGTSSSSDRTSTSSSSDVYDNRPSDTRSGTSSSRSGRGNELDGREIDVRLERELNSGEAQVEDRFQATTVVDMYDGNRVLIPAGSVMRGVVSSVDKATRTDRKGSVTVAFDQITVRGRDYPMRGTVTQALESEGIKGEVAKIGAGSAVGAIIGGIIGGAKGAVLGVLIGGGGTIAATEGKDVTLPPGTILRVRFEQAPDIH